MTISVQRIARFYIPLAFVITISAGMVYIAVQQNYRQSANDPQVQVAEDVAAQLATGRTVTAINPSLNVDIAKSLSNFLLIYDNNGKLVTGSGILNGQTPTPPAGIFDSAKKLGEDRVTWEPQKGLRFALVIIHYAGPNPGYVAAGRSLREVEQRISMLNMQVLAGWLAGIIGLLVLAFAAEMFLARRTPPQLQ